MLSSPPPLTNGMVAIRLDAVRGLRGVEGKDARGGGGGGQRRRGGGGYVDKVAANLARLGEAAAKAHEPVARHGAVGGRPRAAPALARLEEVALEKLVTVLVRALLGWGGGSV